MKRLVLIIAAAVFLSVSGLAFYFYSQWQKTAHLLGGNVEEEIVEITANISESMELPEGETPTLATVTDVEKLKSQSFFKKAQNGDKVLVYANESKAILYRPSTKKVIEVAPVFFDDDKTASPTETPIENSAQVGAPMFATTTLRIAYYNTSGTSVAVREIEDKVIEKMKAETVVIANATSTYSGITVVDIDGKNETETNSIAQLLGGKVGELPQGEQKPDADILIIIGS